MLQFVQALAAINNYTILHRDLKPDNLLFTTNKDETLKLKIIDFGISCCSQDTASLAQKCGTPGYCDPEVLDGRVFTEKSDVFSMGCNMYYMLTGKHLCEGNTVSEIIASNMHMEFDTAIGQLRSISYQLSNSLRRPTIQ